MASCAAGMAFRVYDQNMELVYTFMVGTWGHLFIANKRKNTKIHVNPQTFIPLWAYFAISPFTSMHLFTF